MVALRVPHVTVFDLRSMVMDVLGVSFTTCIKAAMSSAEAVTAGTPRAVQLPAKISAKDSPITARMPNRMSA